MSSATHERPGREWAISEHSRSCLLYTSDAADERSSVDLGGRRIIKKKKNTEQGVSTENNKKEEKTHMTKNNTENKVCEEHTNS